MICLLINFQFQRTRLPHQLLPYGKLRFLLFLEDILGFIFEHYSLRFYSILRISIFSKFVFVDVRSSHEFNFFSIPGSLNIPLDVLEQEDNIDFFCNIVSGKSIIFLCKSGLRSAKAVNLLSKYDIQSLSLDGGIDSWVNLQPI